MKRLFLLFGFLIALFSFTASAGYYQSTNSTALLNSSYSDGGWTPASPTSDGGVSPEHWYKADAGTWQDAGMGTPAASDGDVVGGWEDQAASGDDVTQGTTANKPLLKLNILNGEPVLRFDGTNDRLAGAYTTGGAMSQPLTAFIVFAADNAILADGFLHLAICGDDGANRLEFGKALSPDKWYSLAGSGLAGSTVDASWHIYTILVNGVSSATWKNGISDATGDLGAAVPDGLYVGARHDGQKLWDGDIAEILLYDSSLSDADKNEIGQYLDNKYGITYTDI